MNNKTNDILFKAIGYAIIIAIIGCEAIGYMKVHNSVKLFYNREIHSHILSSIWRGHRDYFNLAEDSDQYYSIYMREITIHKPWNRFSSISMPGDSIFKKNFSDTLVLFANDGIHYYHFDRDNQ